MITVSKQTQIAAAIAAQQAAVDAYQADLIAAGMNYQGNVYAIDATAISNMQTVMLAFLMGQTNPSGGAWPSMVNVEVSMTDAQVKAFILAVQAYVAALIFNVRGLKAQLAKLTTLAAVSAFDITQGWPANNQ
jgi:hypothetical protein